MAARSTWGASSDVGECCAPFTDISREGVLERRDRFLLFQELISDDNDSSSEESASSEADGGSVADLEDFSGEGKSGAVLAEAENRPQCYLKHPLLWNSEDVAQWLESFGYEKWADAFAKCGFEGAKLLQVEASDLEEKAGVRLKGMRLALMSHIYALQEEFCPDGITAYLEKQEELRAIAAAEQAAAAEAERVALLRHASATRIQCVFRKKKAARIVQRLRVGIKVRDYGAADFFAVGLLLAKCESLYGAIFKRRGTLYDLSAGRGLLLFAAFLQSPFHLCVGLETDSRQLRQGIATAERFERKFKRHLPNAEQTRGLEIVHGTFSENADWLKADVVLVDFVLLKIRPGSEEFRAFVRKSGRMKLGAFLIVFTQTKVDVALARLGGTPRSGRSTSALGSSSDSSREMAIVRAQEARNAKAQVMRGDWVCEEAELTEFSRGECLVQVFKKKRSLKTN